MISEEVLSELKEKYGPLFAISIKGIDFVFKEITFEEFDNISRKQQDGFFSSADVEDSVLEKTLVYPDVNSLQRIPAGAVSSLAESVLDGSGFYSAKTAKRILDEKRESIGSEVRPLMKAFVLATMPAYRPEDLDKMTFSELAERVVLAEKIIEVKQTMNGLETSNMKLDLIDPEEEMQKERTKAANYNASRKQGEAAYEDPVARKLWQSL